jgi:hypothetical protein
MMSDPTDSEWLLAACGDIAMENLSVDAVLAAHMVANSAEEFFWAIQAAIKLKEMVNG